MDPRIAVITFPGTNGDIENLRALRRCGFEAFVFRWNDSREKLIGVDGYFIGAGFSYEDRGRAGMVAGRDPVFQYLHEEAAMGKVIIGNCNGCQVLVESELIPSGAGLRMCMAKNLVEGRTVGFLNQWTWMTPACPRNRCAVSNWEGAMHVPIAHGEGRFTTKDRDLLEELVANNQIALSYCDPEGNPTAQSPYCPNGALFGAAAICNPAGNVVGCMPHPERTSLGDPYFHSVRSWVERTARVASVHAGTHGGSGKRALPRRAREGREVFIATIIVNNEERTVEQAARRVARNVQLKQYRYVPLGKRQPSELLSHIAVFNANKEVAYVREGERAYRWDPERRQIVSIRHSPLESGVALVRFDEPAPVLPEGSSEGVCYVCSGIAAEDLEQTSLQEIFANPHASTLELLV